MNNHNRNHLRQNLTFLEREFLSESNFYMPHPTYKNQDYHPMENYFVFHDDQKELRDLFFDIPNVTRAFELFHYELFRRKLAISNPFFFFVVDKEKVSETLNRCKSPHLPITPIVEIVFPFEYSNTELQSIKTKCSCVILDIEESYNSIKSAIPNLSYDFDIIHLPKVINFTTIRRSKTFSNINSIITMNGDRLLG